VMKRRNLSEWSENQLKQWNTAFSWL
jgi:hypothetical protein